MKKRIFLVGVLHFFLVLNGCSSDSGDNSIPTEPEVKGEIKADYISDVSSGDDFIVNIDNTVYNVGQDNVTIKLKKIDLDGKIGELKTLDISNFNSSRLSTSKDGSILLIARNNTEDSDKIFRFEKNFSELNSIYTMKPTSSPYADKVRLVSICDNNDNTHFVYDYSNRQMKRFVSELNTDVLVAGSGKNEIKDGTGLNAGFGTIINIISQNNVLYITDNLYTGASSTFVSSNIRKLEYINNQWKVTTLVSSTTDQYRDIVFDAKNELYVIVQNKGISKLNLQDNSLSIFKEGDLKIGKGDIHFALDYQNIKRMKIKGNDMYLLISGSLIKISDFQSKFALAGK